MSAERVTLYDPDRDNQIRKAVFGSTGNTNRNPVARLGLSASAGNQFDLVGFRRTDADRKPPSRVLTGLLLGDPMPDREARSDALRAKLCMKRQAPSTASPKVVAVLRALAEEPKTIAELSAAMGVGYSAAGDRAAAALARGFISRRGETRYGQRFTLTDQGRAELEAQAQ